MAWRHVESVMTQVTKSHLSSLSRHAAPFSHRYHRRSLFPPNSPFSRNSLRSFPTNSPISLLSSSSSTATAANMATGPGLFSDIGKKAKDLLARDYVTDQKFLVSTLSNTGVAITSSAVKNGGLSTGQVAAIYAYKNTLVNVQVDTASNILTSFIITDILPSTKTMASFILPNYSSGKLEVQYFHHHATITTAAALSKTPVINVSATLGTPAISFGAEAGYDTTSRYIIKYTAGISVTKPECCASIILGEKGDTITASYLHNVDQSGRSVVVGEFNRRFSTNENTFTIGGSYAIDAVTMVKAKLNNNGKLGALLQHELMPKSILTLAGDFDTKALDKAPRFGVALALSP